MKIKQLQQLRQMIRSELTKEARVSKRVPTRKVKIMRLFVKYPAKRWPEYDDVIEKLVGTSCDGSGMGMGTRDMDFSLTEKQAEDALAKLAKLDDVESFADDDYRR